MPAFSECGLIIFLRYPEKGKVKTRIAQSLGEDEALSAYERLTNITLQLAEKLDLPVYLFYDGRIPEKRNQKFFYKNQIPGNLGEKMLSAFEFVLGKHIKAVIIGSDCPEISPEDIVFSFQQLDKYDTVLGPSEDGGYYLLGIKKINPLLFDQIEWGTQNVLQQTLEKIRNLKMSNYLLQTLEDIDTGEQWLRYKKKQFEN